MDQIGAHLADLEQSLLDPMTRADADKVSDLLSDDFLEFGSSGRIWTKATTISGLSVEDENSSTERRVSDLHVRVLSEGAALVTYTVERLSPGEGEVRTLRSSVWKREGERWRMVFHQGTIAT